MAGAQGRRKTKPEGKAEASGSGNAHDVAQKAGKRKTGSVSWEEEVPATRLVRERKAVDRFVPGPQPNEKVREPKVFSIEQGPGTKLQDIPNVVFKLSKGKSDENLQVLHTILYGRKSNVYSWKKNILQFSGFVWAENEEKERAKVKEQLHKCNKERLLLFCELLDIPDMKATTKKEEVSARLLEFLESPHVTRHVVLAENRGRKQKSIKESSQKAHGETLSNIENKKQKRSPSEEVKNFHPNKGSSKEPMRKGSKDKLKEKAVSVKKNSVKITKITSKKSAAVNNRDSGQSSTFNPQMKGKKDGRNDEKKATVVKKTVGKKAAKSASNVSTKGKGKVKVGRKPPPEPTEEEMRAVVVDFADEFEFQKISAGDIFRQLEAYFKMDLSHRREEVRRIIDDVFTDDEEDNQDNDADASRGDDAERSGEDAGEEEDAESSGEDAGEEEVAEGSGEDAGGEEEDAEGSGEDAGGEEDAAEGSDEDAGGAEEDAEGSGEDAGGAEEDAEGSGEDAGGEEDAAEGSDEDAGE